MSNNAIHKWEKLKHLSVKKILNVKDTSRYELPITIEILFGKIIVRGPRKCELGSRLVPTTWGIWPSCRLWQKKNVQ